MKSKMKKIWFMQSLISQKKMEWLPGIEEGRFAGVDGWNAESDKKHC